MINESFKLKPISVQNSSYSMRNYSTEPISKKVSHSISANDKRSIGQGHPKQMYVGNPRNSYRIESTSNKMDRTIIGAIIIGCIFLFITLSITVTIIIFCLKKNTVFVFQKSEQEDIHDCTYEDCLDSISYQSTVHCDDHRFSSCNSAPMIHRNVRNSRNMCEYLNRCPVELFYPMHYDKPYPIQFTHVRNPSHKRCQCAVTNNKFKNLNQCGSNRTLSIKETEQLPWHKIHEGSVYKPLFKEMSMSNSIINNPSEIKVKLDLISDSRQVTTNKDSCIDKPSNDDGPLLEEFIKNSTMPTENDGQISKNIVLTPLGKSQTYTELHPLQNIKSSNIDENQILVSSNRLPKSRSNYDSSLKTKRTL